MSNVVTANSLQCPKCKQTEGLKAIVLETDRMEYEFDAAGDVIENEHVTTVSVVYESFQCECGHEGEPADFGWSNDFKSEREDHSKTRDKMHRNMRVERICHKIATQSHANRQLHATRLWNWIDEHSENPEFHWSIMASEIPWAFRDIANVNSLNFEYA